MRYFRNVNGMDESVEMAEEIRLLLRRDLLEILIVLILNSRKWAF